MRHYVYVTKGDCGRHYIGVRSCECDPAEDPYVGSHKDPEYSPAEKWVWSEFGTREEAANAEASLHEVFDVAVSPHFANRCKALPNGFSMLGISWGIHSEETKALLSQQKKGENNHRWGKPSSQKQKEAVRRARAGVKVSEETRQKMREAQRIEGMKKRGKRLYHDPKTQETKMCWPGEEPEGWEKGQPPYIMSKRFG
jgi:hypothetical protein